ncbi:outer membrane beta barrel protein [Actinomadura fibrosa]
MKAQETPEVDLGGALRFNYNLSSWKPEQKKRGGDFGYDMFRINAMAAYRGIYVNAEYRHYSEGFGGGMLKQGWFGYKFNEEEEIQLGLTQVPFAIQQYNSHNWFFNLGYYMGLEDDHDMGIKFIHNSENWEYHIAYFKNAEELRFGDVSAVSASRYSYDVAGNNKEVHQGNLKFLYKWGENLKSQVGVSGQYGGLYNINTKKTGNHHALAVHYEADYKLWNLKSEAILVSHNPKNEKGVSEEIIVMAAYGAPYEVASDFNLYTIAVSRDLPVNWGPVSNLQFYNDFGYMQKREGSFEDSFMNVTGVLITAGNLYTYVDYAAGYNHSWLGGNFVDDFAAGNPDAKWEARFNINFGYYF